MGGKANIDEREMMSIRVYDFRELKIVLLVLA